MKKRIKQNPEVFFIIFLLLIISSCQKSDDIDSKTPIKIGEINVNGETTRSTNDSYDLTEVKLHLDIEPNADKGYVGKSYNADYYLKYKEWVNADADNQIYMEDLFPSLLTNKLGYIILDHYKINLSTKDRDSLVVMDQSTTEKFINADYLSGYGGFHKSNIIYGDLYHKNIYLEVRINGISFDEKEFLNYLKNNETKLEFYLRDQSKIVKSYKYISGNTVLFSAYIPIKDIPLFEQNLFRITDFIDGSKTVDCTYKGYSIKPGDKLEIKATYSSEKIIATTIVISISDYANGGEFKINK
jgi:hypothetical protein